MIVTSTSLVIKMELVRVTESAVTMEEDMSAELMTEKKLHGKTVEHTKHVLATYRLENRCPHKLFDWCVLYPSPHTCTPLQVEYHLMIS